MQAKIMRFKYTYIFLMASYNLSVNPRLCKDCLYEHCNTGCFVYYLYRKVGLICPCGVYLF